MSIHTCTHTYICTYMYMSTYMHTLNCTRERGGSGERREWGEGSGEKGVGRREGGGGSREEGVGSNGNN